MTFNRRQFLGASASALLLGSFTRGYRKAHADHTGQRAQRLIVFYFPDGVVGASQGGDASLWHASGSGSSFTLPTPLASLESFRDRCVFFRGLSMGGTDAGSHPGGAKKLLTGADGGNGMSIDRHLANTVGSDHPFRHIYLGAMANHNGASGDKHISYPAAGVTSPPEDDPAAAFVHLFGALQPGGGGMSPADDMQARKRLSAIDFAKSDLEHLRGRLDQKEKAKLEFHLESFREVEQRIAGMGGGGGIASCDAPFVNLDGVDSSQLYDPARFPAVLRAQTDIMVQAMACGLSRVGVVQGSHHTSELIMSRFPDTAMHDPGFDMRSHQASHYGASHDPNHREFRDFMLQRTWWAEQFAYLLQELDRRPEGDGTMLDHSLVLLCTEVSDGNTHSHDDMPFVLAGGGSGSIRTGNLWQSGYHRHGDLLAGIAHAMGEPVQGWGQGSSGPLPGLLS